MNEITYRFLGEGRPNTAPLRYDERVVFLNFRNKVEYKMQSWHERTRRRSHWRSLDMIQRFAEERADEFATKFVRWLLTTVQLAPGQQIQIQIELLQLSRHRIPHEFAKPSPSFHGHWCTLPRIATYKHMRITSNCCRTLFPFLKYSNFIWHRTASNFIHTQSKNQDLRKW